MKHVGELVVHCVEITVVEILDAVQVHRIKFVERNLDSALCQTEHLCVVGGVDCRRTDEVKNAGSVFLQEVLVWNNAVVHVKPVVLAKHCQINRVLILGWNQVVALVGHHVLHAVSQRAVVRHAEAVVAELVELISRRCRVKLTFAVVEDAVRIEIIVGACRKRHTHTESNSCYINIFFEIHDCLII